MVTQRDNNYRLHGIIRIVGTLVTKDLAQVSAKKKKRFNLGQFRAHFDLGLAVSQIIKWIRGPFGRHTTQHKSPKLKEQ